MHQPILAPLIHEYLGSDKHYDASILQEAAQKMGQSILRQFMTERHNEPGKYYPSQATYCVLKNYYQYIGAPRDPMDGQTQLKLWFGDLIEIGVLTLAQLALKKTRYSIGMDNELIDVPIGKGDLAEKAKIRGRIDGLLDYEKLHVIEIKSMAAYPFEKFEKNGPDDMWGYCGQVSVYQRALQVKDYLFIAVHKDTAKISEWVGTYERQYCVQADATYDAVMEAVQAKTLPPRPSAMHPVPGKSGYELCISCAFCAYKWTCWGDKNLVRVIVSGRYGDKTVYKLRQGFDWDAAIRNGVAAAMEKAPK